MASKSQIPHPLCLIVQAESRIPAESLRPEYLSGLDAILPTGGVVSAGEVTVQLMAGDNWTFDMVRNHHSCPCNSPMAFEIFNSSTTGDIFVRMWVDVDAYDGVSLLHTGLNILEYLEGGPESKLTKLIFKNPDSTFVLRNRVHFVRHISGLLLRLVRDLFVRMGVGFFAPRLRRQSVYSGPLGVLAGRFLGGAASPTCLMYRMSDSEFKGAVDKVDALRKELGFLGYVCTVNYRPHVALSAVDSREAIMNAQARVDGIITAAAPVPRAQFGPSFFLSNHCFWNNYGRYHPGLKSKLSLVYWDWITLPWYTRMIVHTISIQGVCWIMLRVPPTSAKFVKEYLASFGLPLEFTGMRLNACEPLSSGTHQIRTSS